MIASIENIRKALHIHAEATAPKMSERAERDDLLEIANRVEARHVANPRRRLSRINALTVALEVAQEGRLRGYRVKAAIEWFEDCEPEIYEMAEYLAGA